MSYYPGEGGIPAVMNVQPTNNGNYGSCGGWGGDWSVWILAFFLMAMCGGFGGFGGWGGFGGFGSGFGGGYPTESILQRSLDTQTIIGKLDGVSNGLCDGFYAQNNALNGLGMNVMQGFHGVDNAVCQLGYQTQQGFNATQVAMMQGNNALSTQLGDCCCKNQTGQMQLGNQMERGFCDVNYNQATSTNAIIQNAHNDTDRVLARLEAMESSRKDERIAQQEQTINQLQLAASMANERAATRAMIDASTAEILRRSGHDCPSAAYIVQPPQPVSFATNCSGQAVLNNGWNNCGNGNGYGNNCGNCGF